MRIIPDSEYVTKNDRIKDMFKKQGISWPVELLLEATGIKDRKALRTHLYNLRKAKTDKMDIRIVRNEAVRYR